MKYLSIILIPFLFINSCKVYNPSGIRLIDISKNTNEFVGSIKYKFKSNTNFFYVKSEKKVNVSIMSSSGSISLYPTQFMLYDKSYQKITITNCLNIKRMPYKTSIYLRIGDTTNTIDNKYLSLEFEK